MKNEHISTADALEQLAGQVNYLYTQIEAAKNSGNTKLYCSLLRLYLPALKEYVRLSNAQDGEQEDALLAFAGGMD